jgi:hypothetical protein
VVRIHWLAFYAWLGIAVVGSIILLREELGILHTFGLIPITWVAVNNPVLFWAIAIAGPTLTVWWIVHVYRRKYGDLKGSAGG